MNRPLLLRSLPDRLRMSIAARFYRPPAPRWHPLYRQAPLRFAPGVTIDLMPGDVISDAIAMTGIWELHLTRKVAELARRGGTLIDVGANLGYFSLLWAGSNPGNRAYAFEASPRNLDYLRRSVERNGFGDRITIIPHAAGREPGALAFDVGPGEQTGWGGFAAEGKPEPSAITVEVVRVQDVVDTPGPIALLKVDIEGADLWALMGCERLLRERRVERVWFEQNKPRMRALGIDEGAAEEFFRSVGYVARPESDPTKALVEWSAVPA